MSTLITRAFYFSDTHGIPLSMQLDYAATSGATVSLPHYYRDALAAGWAPERALARVEGALVDVGLPAQGVAARIDWLRATKGQQLPSVTP